MDKKANNKTLNFFKKEGFYVVLFICLCIVATVATITASNNKKFSSNQEAIKNEQANAGDVLKEQEKQYQDALQVKKENSGKNEVLKPVPNIQKVTTGNLTSPVSKSVNATFTKPVANGLLARGYSKDIDYSYRWKTDGSYRTNLGIAIQAKLGEPVLAVMDGIVEKVGSDEKGKMVEIKHQNGTITKYYNLEEKILVKNGDKITKKQQIGTVGNTSLNSCNEVYGPHLYFEVLEKNIDPKTSKTIEYINVDPTRYVQYEKYQPVATKQ
ncbi:M23 family metallopeptidase [Clostridium estertheticum]|uniref:M23 family metallopeptidase n=1 Tax=Clostridium estertheticum TaxID=238834 RepID=UPI0013E91D6E|nr:M23 family metallopeptidase [Clostridium estertheticum]MBZ9685075.1 M23 family metallopeptidase [Clostridium estertheticum]